MSERSELEVEAVDKALTETITKLTADNEALRKQILDAGFKITAEGLVAKEAEEMIEVDGEQFAVASLPASVVTALKAKADAELTAKSVEAYPNLRPDVAKKLYATFKDDAEMSEALKGFNHQMGTLLEEQGNTDPGVETMTAQEKFDKAVKDEQAASGTTFHAAYSKVAMTAEGKQLISQIYKEKE